MDHLDDFEELNELIKSIGDIEISTEGFSKEVILEFTEVAQDLDLETYNQLQPDVENLDIPTLKKIMVGLAFTGTVEAYRQLESLEQILPASLQEFYKMSKIFGRMRLENELLGQNKGILITGLGGNSTQMRYYVALFATAGTTINEQLVKQCETDFEDLSLSYETQIESIEFTDSYILIKLLGSFNHNIHDLISDVLETSPRLHPNYLVTNVERPSEDLLEEMAADPDAAYNDQDNDNSLPQSLIDHMHTLGIQLDVDEFDEDEDEYDDDDDEEEDEYDDEDLLETLESLYSATADSHTPFSHVDLLASDTDSDNDFLPDLAAIDAALTDDSQQYLDVDPPSEPDSPCAHDDPENFSDDTDNWLENNGKQALFYPVEEFETAHIDHDTAGDPTDEDNDIDQVTTNNPDIQPGPDSENDDPPGDNRRSL
jgi:hypothetical protein